MSSNYNPLWMSLVSGSGMSVLVPTYIGAYTFNPNEMRGEVKEIKIDKVLFLVATFPRLIPEPQGGPVFPQYEGRNFTEGDGSTSRNMVSGFECVPCVEDEICILYNTVSGDVFVHTHFETQKVR